MRPVRSVRGSCHLDIVRDASEPETFRYEQHEVHWDHGLRLVRDQEARGRGKNAVPILLEDPATLKINEGVAHHGIGFRLVFTQVED